MVCPDRLLVLNLRRDIQFRLQLSPAEAFANRFPQEPEAEGEQRLHVFGAELFASGDSGPTCHRPLPYPVESWAVGDQERMPSRQQASLSITAGRWLFAQCRPKIREELEDALEWFAREAWWESRELEGPWLLRLVREDGKTAVQFLRRLLQDRVDSSNSGCR